MTDTMEQTSVDSRKAMMVKIQALIEKAESTDFEAERDAYMAKAQALLAKHAIGYDELQGSARVADTIVTSRVLIVGPFAQSKTLLFDTIARANGCRVVNGNDYKYDNVSERGMRTPGGALLTPEDFVGKGRFIHVTGWSRDVEASAMLYTSLLVQMYREFAKTERPSWENGKAWHNSFILGFNNGVGPRLTQARQDAEAEAVVEHGDDLLPVLRNRKAQVNDAFEEQWQGRLRTGRGAGSTGGGGSAGRAAGARADTGRARVSTGGGRALGRG